MPTKTPRLSLKYVSSSPMKTMKTVDEGKRNGNADISGISPIKTVKLPPQTSSNQKKKKYAVTSPMQTSNTSKTNFELNSFDDFPAITHVYFNIFKFLGFRLL